jgi:hypothetical protein
MAALDGPGAGQAIASLASLGYEAAAGAIGGK